MGERPALIVARHAPVQPEWAGRCYGASDVEVTVTHAEAAARILAGLAEAVDRVWSSPLSRCQGPAALVAAELGLEHRIDARVAELDHGAFEGRAWDEIQGSEPRALERWGERWLHEGPPGGESARDVEARVRAWEAELDFAERHLLVAHAGAVRALRVIRRGTSWDEALRVPVPHLVPHAS